MNDQKNDIPEDLNPVPASGPVLQIISGHDVGKRLKVLQPCIIGRASDCDLILTDRTISRHHLIVRPLGGGLMIRDLGSRNGAFLNGHRIKDDELVKHGDVILVGETFISVQYPKFMAHERYGSHLLITVSTSAASSFDEVSHPEKLGKENLSQKELNILLEVMGIVKEESNEVTALKHATRRLIEVFNADSAVLCMPSQTDFEPAIILAREKKTQLLTGILQATLMQRKGMLIKNAMKVDNADLTGKIPRNLPASQMCVPFIHNEQISGLLALGARRPEAFDRQALNLLTVMANHLAPVVARAAEREHPEQIHAILPETSHSIIGDSEAVKNLRHLIGQVAHLPVTVLVTGETGTGKELVARAIHESGLTPDGPFVTVNCAAIPSDIFEAELFGYEKGAFTGAFRSKPGKIELACNGTLFLDEIGDLPYHLQAKLLRVLETQEIMRLGGTQLIRTNVRFVFATNKDLKVMVDENRFREDLFFRINTIEIFVPPLRERLEDIPELADFFLDKIQSQLGRVAPFLFSSSVLGSFLAYNWPGNVRELRNVLEQMAVLADGSLLEEHLLPQRIRVATPSPSMQDSDKSGPGLLNSITDQTQKQLILHALKEAGGQKKRAAEILGISRPTLDKKLRMFGIDVEDF